MSEYFNVADIFGEDVFTDKVMQERLPKKVYRALRKTIEEGKELDLATADVIAAADEGLGDRKRSNPLYALVPAADRRYR